MITMKKNKVINSVSRSHNKVIIIDEIYFVSNSVGKNIFFYFVLILCLSVKFISNLSMKIFS
jgi:hypothetical protein